jgi:quercetin dioxygenase-like cupin family protein
MLAPAGRDVKVNPMFTLESERTEKTSARLAAVPTAMQPDRQESMNERGSGKIIDIARGVRFDCLVGKHNEAQNLTTGIATFDPGATLPCHTHPFSESITLLSGSAILEVEGRRYRLNVMDNVVLPRNLSHQVVNVSSSHPAVFHVAMASSEPTRTLVDRFFSRRAMPEFAASIEGAERLNWFKTTPRSQAGPGATFMDYFNRELIPGIEMSGGHGTFAPGGRLPCHIHDFDESICIIQGVATCIVEGRKYTMSDCITALQPRGRCHYFINESESPMVMLWVYAGPMPERIMMEEQACAVPLVKSSNARPAWSGAR